MNYCTLFCKTPHLQNGAKFPQLVDCGRGKTPDVGSAIYDAEFARFPWKTTDIGWFGGSLAELQAANRQGDFAGFLSNPRISRVFRGKPRKSRARKTERRSRSRQGISDILLLSFSPQKLEQKKDRRAVLLLLAHDLQALQHVQQTCF